MLTGRSDIFTIKFSMKPLIENIDLLNVQLQLVATPALTFLKEDGSKQPAVTASENARNGFVFELEAFLPYSQLSTTATAYLRGTRLDISEGFIKKHIIIDGCKLYGQNGRLVIEAFFSGSFDGTVVLKGTPFYNPHAQTITLQTVTYDLKTANLLLKGLQWLLHKLILDQIKKYTVIDIAAYRQKATEGLTKLLNQEMTKGVQIAGNITALEVTSIEARQNELLIGMRCSGNLHLTLSALQVSL